MIRSHEKVRLAENSVGPVAGISGAMQRDDADVAAVPIDCTQRSSMWTAEGLGAMGVAARVIGHARAPFAAPPPASRAP